MKNGFDEDILTIPDDVSDSRSKISYKTNNNMNYGVATSDFSFAQSSRIKYGLDGRADTIIEDKQEEEKDNNMG